MELQTILTNLVSSVLFSALLFLYAVSSKFRIYLVICFNWIRLKLMKKKIIFIWNDDDTFYSQNIIDSLKSRTSKFYYIALEAPEEILKYPLAKKNIHLICFLVSDVTKLSSDNKVREKIQTKILDYVSKGGTFIGSHDILYRRTKNEKFQSAFGCKITKFKTINSPIGYKINHEFQHHKLVSGLPECFTLEDTEVCWGEWDDTAMKLLVSERKYNGTSEIPLFILKKYESGSLVWFNSGDKSEEGMCKSIKNPDMKLIQILINVIEYAEEEAA